MDAFYIYIYIKSFCLQQVRMGGFESMFSSWKELDNAIELQGSWQI